MPLAPPDNTQTTIFYDRVRETTSTSGTGTVTLSGAVTGYQSFAVVGDGNTCYYCIADRAGNNWEVGSGTYTAAGTTLSRDTVFSSSNSNALCNFDSSLKDVYVTQPAVIATKQILAGVHTITVANTTVETTLVPGGIGTSTLIANQLINGKTIRWIAKGYLSTLASPGTLTINFKVGGTTMATTGAFTPAGSLANNYWACEVEFCTRTVGVTGTIFCQGHFLYSKGSLAMDFAPMGNTATSTVNTTTALAVDFTAKWQTASASNSISLTNGTISGY